MKSSNGKDGCYKFRLYVAGTAPHSARALENLRALCEHHLTGRYEIEVIDVLAEPGRALEGGVYVTPTLIKLAPGDVRRILGDLGNEAILLDVLAVSRHGS